jgi:peptidoglycan hydrolase-like protein with peptidoglycan-binding domain
MVNSTQDYRNPNFNWDEHFTRVSEQYKLRRKREKILESFSPFGLEFLGMDFGIGGNLTSHVQEKLNSLGMANPPLVVDGKAGQLTAQAIIAYQQSKGLPPTGIINQTLLQALNLHLSDGQTVLPPANKPLSPDDAVKAISQGYQKVTGKVPSAQILGLLAGQTALETGNWQKMPNFNFGGIKASSKDPYVQVFTTTEVYNGITQTLDQKFAAYKTAADGAAAYIKTLMARSNWWSGLETGTPQGFVAGLTSSPAYFTADPSQYLAGLSSRMNSYSALADKYATEIKDVTYVIAGATTAIVATIGGILWWKFGRA